VEFPYIALARSLPPPRAASGESDEQEKTREGRTCVTYQEVSPYRVKYVHLYIKSQSHSKCSGDRDPSWLCK